MTELQIVITPYEILPTTTTSPIPKAISILLLHGPT